MAKTRSRNYPSESLGDAIGRARELYKKEGKARVPASVAVLAWGYSSINGASLRVVSALRQYGLLEGGNEDLRLTPLALTLLLEPEESPDYWAAIEQALHSPAMFQEILQEYDSGLPSDSAITSYLVRKQNFSEDAARTLIASLRDSLELVESKTPQYVAPMALANAEPQRATSESAKSFNDNDFEVVVDQWKLEYTWALSGNTAATVRISGEVPSAEDMELLSQWVDLAKLQIKREVERMRLAMSQPASAEEQ